MTDWLDLNQDDEHALRAFMARVAALPVPELRARNSESAERGSSPESRVPSVQDPARLWWKAQLLKKWEAERRAELPLNVMHSFEIAGGFAAAGLMLYWSLPYLF